MQIGSARATDDDESGEDVSSPRSGNEIAKVVRTRPSYERSERDGSYFHSRIPFRRTVLQRIRADICASFERSSSARQRYERTLRFSESGFPY